MTSKLAHNTNEKWVKKMLRTSDPGPLAELIEERIKWPTHTGPYIQPSSDEKAVDIISEIIVAYPDLHKKIELAVGLTLWKMLKKHMDEKSELLYGAFTLIRDNKFANCGLLVYEWISKNTQYLKADNKHGTDLYTYALFTFGAIQPIPDKNIETYWLGLWKDAKPQFWAAAFSGLRKQSSMAAIDELPLLIKRNTDNTGNHLSAMLFDDVCWPLLKQRLRSGLDKGEELSGLALNSLLSKLTKDQQSKVFGQLQSIKNGNSPTS